MTILTTSRLRLEPCSEAHLNDLDILNSDIEVMRYITGTTVSLEDTKAHLHFVSELWKAYGFSSWSIFERSSNQFIGTAGVNHIEFNPNNPIEMGWRLLPALWGKGFATETADCILTFVFETIKLDYLYAICHQKNIKSANVMQRVGMHYRGIEPWYNLETLVYGMSKNEYHAIHQKRADCVAVA